MNTLSRAIRNRLLYLTSIALLAGLNGACSQSDGGSRAVQTEQTLVLSSKSRVIDVFESASTTLAVSEQKSGAPGDTIDFVAFTYDTDSEAPLSGGMIEFSAELESDVGSDTLQIPIGAAALINGQADIAWETPTEFFGEYLIRATFAGDASIAPSEWQFRQPIARPDNAGAVRYAMARLNHLVTLMSGPDNAGSMLVDSVFVDGPDSLLSDVLADEFGLELLEGYYRLERGGNRFVIDGDVETYLKSFGFDRTKEVHNMSVRTSFFLAANDNVLVLVIKGTDGSVNEAVNAEGSPARLLSSGGLLTDINLFFHGGDGVAVHPGWAWMTDMLVSGFIASNGQDFQGLTNLVNQHRINANGEERRLYIGGHSLGGALSRMSALALAADGATRLGDRVYTFGAPWQGAYNTLLGFTNFERHARATFENNGIELTTVEGYLDPIPLLPESIVAKNWRDGLPSFGDYLKDIAKIGCKIANEISSWFGGGDRCALTISRPVGFESPPRVSNNGFNSKSHFKRYMNGAIAVERCATQLVNGVNMEPLCNVVPEPDCQLDVLTKCERLYHSTDVGGSDDPVRKRAHWVGDYEDNEKQRLRGDPTRYNFYYPASRHGDIRKPLEIVVLP